MLLQARTEINYWYHEFGWARCDELISNLEAVSGLKADDDKYKNYTNDERNAFITKYYQKRRDYAQSQAKQQISPEVLKNIVRRKK